MLFGEFLEVKEDGRMHFLTSLETLKYILHAHKETTFLYACLAEAREEWNQINL